MDKASTSGFDFDVSRWPALPRMRGIFVTATDAGVGKTLVAGAIARHLRHLGRTVDVFKPVATGCRRVSGELVSEEAEFLAACADSPRTLAEINPLRYRLPLAPYVAARRAGEELDPKVILDAYARLEGAGDVTIVDGVGGLMSPITEDLWTVHLAKMMALSVVIVALPGHGTVNHALLTIYAARTAGLSVAGVVINRYVVEAAAAEESKDPEIASQKPDLSPLSNPYQIARLGGVEILAIVPDEPANSVAKGTIGPDTQFAIGQGQWENVIDGRRG